MHIIKVVSSKHYLPSVFVGLLADVFLLPPFQGYRYSPPISQRAWGYSQQILGTESKFLGRLNGNRLDQPVALKCTLPGSDLAFQKGHQAPSKGL